MRTSEKIALDVDVAQLDHPLIALKMPDDLGKQELRALPHARVVERPGDHDRRAVHPLPGHIFHGHITHRVIVLRRSQHRLIDHIHRRVATTALP
jgi:hypothetical protein